jgi:5-methylcytosine-specific restriction endonuclease McrA
MDATDALEWESEFPEFPEWETESRQGLTIEEIWKHLPKSHPDEAICWEWHAENIPAILRELRDTVNPWTYIDISVVVPVCDPCCWTDEHKPFPIVWGPDWLQGYKNLGLFIGLSRSQIAAMARAVRNAFRNDSWLPTCWQCGSSIDLNSEEGFHIRHVSFAEYFHCAESAGSRIPPRIKKVVHQVLGTQCVLCQRETTELDHIVARAKGGLAEVTNLQPMCHECNVEKADRDVEIVSVNLIFRLWP